MLLRSEEGLPETGWQNKFADMKRSLQILSLFVLLIASGCSTYFSQIKLDSTDTSTLMANVTGVEKETDKTLGELHFQPYPEEWKKNDIYLFAGWVLTEKENWASSGAHITVEMSVNKNSIVLFVRSDEAWSKGEVEKIQNALKQMAENKFPNLKIQVSSWSSFLNGWPN
jgi:uncharacterized protein YbcV (DUF1398 family)